MAYYHRLGNIPPKRHIQFRKNDGTLFAEELVSSEGFSGIYSLLYHHFEPTKIVKIGSPDPVAVEAAKDQYLAPTHLKTSTEGITGKDFLSARIPLFTNTDVTLSICNPSEQKIDWFYKNGEADEVIFVHDGSGVLYSQFGKLAFRQGDYLVIPRTVIYKIEFSPDPVRLLVIESAGPVETVKRYRNELGQLLEHSPYCERDIRPPSELITDTDIRECLIKIKKQGYIYNYFYNHSPFDVEGWDGFLYPYALSIHDFEPITGRIHQPPPVHQTFQAQNFVICSFVPRLYDYHPLAVTVPYNHSNIDSDEVLYYAEGNFMSRRDIDRGSFTLHPGGIPHGPHPGTVEAGLGKKATDELAVMIDTFKPLHITEQALKYLDKNYPMSWNA